MKQILRPILGGVAVGIANVIPGVSGGTLMVIMGIFDRAMNAISDVFKPKNPHRKQDILFLVEVLLGAGIGIVGFSAILKWLFAVIPMPTVFWFIGLVAFSVPIFKKNQMQSISVHIPALLCAVALILLLTAAQIFWLPAPAADTAEIPAFSFSLCAVLFFSGIVGGFAMLLPGISGSLMLMILGVYQLVVLGYIGNLATIFRSFSGETLLSLVPLLFFAIGAVLGIVLSAKLTSFALRKNRRITLSFLLGLIAASVVSLVALNLDRFTAALPMIFGSIFAFLLGGVMVWLIGGRQKREA